MRGSVQGGDNGVTAFLTLPPNDNSRRRKPPHFAFPPYSRKLINYQLRDSYRLSICIELIINSNISIQERQQCGARELLGSHWKHPNKCSYWTVRQEPKLTAWTRHRHSGGHCKRLCNTCAGYYMLMWHGWRAHARRPARAVLPWAIERQLLVAVLRLADRDLGCCIPAVPESPHMP